MTRFDLRDATNVDALLDALATGDDIFAGEAPHVPLRMAGESRATQALQHFARSLPREGSATAGPLTRGEPSFRSGSVPTSKHEDAASSHRGVS